jgi:hypothetical protein
MDRSEGLGTAADPAKRKVTCIVCATHSQPHLVPWTQHAMGCVVRARLLLELPPTAPQPTRQPALD